MRNVTYYKTRTTDGLTKRPKWINKMRERVLQQEVKKLQIIPGHTINCWIRVLHQDYTQVAKDKIEVKKTNVLVYVGFIFSDVDIAYTEWLELKMSKIHLLW